MKYRAGFLKVVCAGMVILMQSLDAGHAPKIHPAAVSCRPKPLTDLIKSQVKESLKSFDEANGKDLPTWTLGFPELQVHQNSPLHVSKVQCSLHFMASGLEKVLCDQKNHLSPQDHSLHKQLKCTISRVKMLADCLKEIHGGECSHKPNPPRMPKYVFDRKRWSHTLLQKARDYLDWLGRKFEVQISKVKGKNNIKRTVSEATHQKYLEGSGYLL